MSIRQVVGTAHAFAQLALVDWRDAPEDAPRAFGAADEAGLAGVTEDHGMAFGGALDARYPVQRVAAIENLQVAGLQLQAFHRAAIAFEHLLYGVEIFAVGIAYPRTVLERAATFGRLRHQRDDEDRKSTRLNSSHVSISY